MGRSVIISSHSETFIKQALEKVLKEINISRNDPVDLMIIRAEDKDKLSIGIESVKELKEWSKTKPYKSDTKAAVIFHAEVMTEEAQNSILKILEEPTLSLTIILTCTNYQSLLSTVISRCEKIIDNTGEKDGISDFYKLKLSDKLGFVRKLVERKKKSRNNEEINEFLVNLLYFYRENLLKNVNIKDTSFNIKLIHETDRMIKANVLPKLALENLVINLR